MDRSQKWCRSAALLVGDEQRQQRRQEKNDRRGMQSAMRPHDRMDVVAWIRRDKNGSHRCDCQQGDQNRGKAGAVETHDTNSRVECPTRGAGGDYTLFVARSRHKR